MQHNRILRLERCFWRGVASWWPVGGRGKRADMCCITVACRRKRLASECLLHHWCNTLGFQGLRDVTGEMLHHGGMLKEGLVSVCCIRVNVATNSYKPCQWDRAQFWGGRIVTVASWVMVATVLQQTTHKRRGLQYQGNVARWLCLELKVMLHHIRKTTHYLNTLNFTWFVLTTCIYWKLWYNQ